MLKKYVLSIDIGDELVKIVEGKQNGGELIINKSTLLDTPHKACINGNIKDIESMKKAIGHQLVLNRIRSKQVICTINSTHIITRAFIIPRVERKELNALINYEVEESLPIVIDDYFIEYKWIGELKDENNARKIMVFVAAMPKQMAEQYYDLFKSITLKPLALDISTNSVLKMLKFYNHYNKNNMVFRGSIGFVELECFYTNVVVVEEGVIQINRLLLSDIKDKIDDLFVDIQKVFTYYTTRKVGNTIDKIIIYGSESSLNSLPNYFKQYFGIHTFSIDMLEIVKPRKKSLAIDINLFFNAISSLIRE